MKTLWCCVIIMAAVVVMPASHTFHDEPGSFREYELKQERIDIEINITELLHQLTYVETRVRPRVYEELTELQQRWHRVIEELIQIDRIEHPQPPVK
jgi:hypothetical protein